MRVGIYTKNISFRLKCQFGVNRTEEGFKEEVVNPFLTVPGCTSACSDTGVCADTFWSNYSCCKTEAYKLGLCHLVMKLTDLCTYSCRFEYFISMECKERRPFLCHSCLKCIREANKMK